MRVVIVFGVNLGHPIVTNGACSCQVLELGPALALRLGQVLGLVSK